MNIQHLHHWVEVCAHVGQTFGFESFHVPLHSLRTVHVQNHFKNTFYWGRIHGTQTDYYIAFGYETDILKNCKYFYSIDGVFWNLMPSVNDAIKTLALNCTSRMRGDPSFTIEVGEGPCEMDEHGFFNQEGALKEEDRLAAVVELITEDTAVVPRCALYRSHDGIVIENPMFRGLDEIESPELLNYYHLREPREKFNTRLRTSSDNNFEFDFLDSIDMHIPEETWSMRLELSNFEELIILRNLEWLGMHFFHFIKTPFHGFFYAGEGKKNVDLPFMLDLPSKTEEVEEETR